MDVILASPSDRNTWDSFVSSHPLSRVFHLWSWGDLADQVYDHQRFYLMVKEGDDVVGVLPLIFIDSRLFGRKLISLPYCEYGGPLFSDVAVPSRGAQEMLQEALKIAGEENVDSVELRGLPDSLCSVAGEAGFRPHANNVIFKLALVAGAESIWNNFEGGRVRTAVRKAEKVGVTLEEANCDSDLSDYYRLRLVTEKRHGSPIHSFEFYRHIWESRVEKNQIKLWFATHEGERKAAIIFFPFNSEVLYWSSVGTDEAKRIEATTFLVWKAIEWGSENSFRVFDMGRTRPGTGVYSYKKSFGAIEGPLHDYVWTPSGEPVEPLDPDKGIYRFLTSLWSKLPVGVNRTLGPRIVKDIGL